jgi:hypothetical protein
VPPPTGLHWHYTQDAADCLNCHGGAGWFDLALHVNGVTDVTNDVWSWDGRNCTSSCHGNAPRPWY